MRSHEPSVRDLLCLTEQGFCSMTNHSCLRPMDPGDHYTTQNEGRGKFRLTSGERQGDCVRRTMQHGTMRSGLGRNKAHKKWAPTPKIFHLDRATASTGRKETSFWLRQASLSLGTASWSSMCAWMKSDQIDEGWRRIGPRLCQLQGFQSQRCVPGASL